MIKTNCDICKVELGFIIETEIYICEKCCWSYNTEHELFNAVYEIRRQQQKLTKIQFDEIDIERL